MNKSPETIVDTDFTLVNLLASIPKSMMGSRKRNVVEDAFPAIRTKYDNPNDALAAFLNHKEVIERKPFEAPKSHRSEVSDKPFVRPPKQDERSVKATARFQQKYFEKANRKLQRQATKSNNVLVYDRINSKLAFSGPIEQAVPFVLGKVDRKEWDDNSWAIYLPEK